MIAALPFLLACHVSMGAQQAEVIPAPGPPSAGVVAVQNCRTETDDRRRLACYDRWFGAAPAVFADRADDEQSPMTRFWELAPRYKRGTFTIRTFKPNFFLPINLNQGINRRPMSPSQPVPPGDVSYRAAETKLQLSLRTKVAEGFLLPQADLWFAYTQQSIWQLYDREGSSPFRATDHAPEMIYVLPVSSSNSELPWGWRWRMLQAGIVHQSNGQSDPLSRSWNRVYVSGLAERGEVGIRLRLDQRIRERGGDDNPDIMRHIGNGEVMMSWYPGQSIASLTLRSHVGEFRRGSLQLDWNHPLDSTRPDGIRWYLQVFSGYGATLLDYNFHQTSVGLGLSLFQF